MNEPISKPERVRFAPAPSGYLHVGNTRTAILNFFVAQKTGGTFVLRIEDTDKKRCTREAIDGIVSTLTALEIEPDEGPHKGGPYAPYIQSERAQIYEDKAGELLKSGKAYYCFCEESELEQMRFAQRAAGKKPRYDNRCRNLTDADRQRLLAEGRKPAIRLMLPQKKVRFHDVINKDMEFDLADEGDPILMRSDKRPTYLLAATVDDVIMQITTVIRGADLLSTTPRQIALYEAFGKEPPRFAHMGLLLGPGGSPLSKRHGDLSIIKILESGMHPQALSVFLAALGMAWEGGVIPETYDSAINGFALEHVSPNPVIFDFEAMKIFNKKFINNLPPDKALETCEKLWKGNNVIESVNPAQKTLLAQLAVDAAEDTLSIVPFAEQLIKGDFSFNEEALKLIDKESVHKIADFIASYNASGGQFVAETFVSDMAKATVLSGKRLYLPLRLMLTGASHGPKIAKIIEFLGTEELKKRSHNFLTKYFV